MAQTSESVNLLWRAIETGDSSLVSELLTKGMSVDSANAYGTTPLMRAAAIGHKQIVCLLLECGANPNETRNDGFTPLLLAAFFGHMDVVKILLGHGADGQAATRHGTSAQMWAAARTFQEVADFLQQQDDESIANAVEIPFEQVEHVDPPDHPTASKKRYVQTPTFASFDISYAEHLFRRLRSPNRAEVLFACAMCGLLVVVGTLTALTFRLTEVSPITAAPTVVAVEPPAANSTFAGIVSAEIVSKEPERLVDEQNPAKTTNSKTSFQADFSPLETTAINPTTEAKPEPSVSPETNVASSNDQAVRPRTAESKPTSTGNQTAEVINSSRSDTPRRSYELISPSKSSSKSGKTIAWP